MGEDSFWGIDTWLVLLAGAGRLGVVAADRVLPAGAEVGPVDLVDRAGLVSCWLFFRDLVPGTGLKAVDR